MALLNLNYSTNNQVKNTLFQYLTNEEDGSQKPLTTFFIDEDGEVAGLPIVVKLENLHQFIEHFKGAYVGFSDGSVRLFELSDGLLCYVNSEVPIKRSDIRLVLYNCGMKDIS